MGARPPSITLRRQHSGDRWGGLTGGGGPDAIDAFSSSPLPRSLAKAQERLNGVGADCAWCRPGPPRPGIVRF
jgi:hypothetical protein